MPLQLSGFEGDQPDIKLKVNKEFAKSYEISRKSEELMKLKARYGDVDLNEASESDSESEDEDAEELTADVEQKWLKTLAALKSDDPRIYDETTNFFGNEDETRGKERPKKVGSKKTKRVTLKDMDRKVITERDGVYSDSSDPGTPPPKTKGYYEEQDEIRNSIRKAHRQHSEEDGDSDIDLLTVKVKTAAEKEADEEEYRKFVKGQEANVDADIVKDLSGLRDYWNRDDMSDADKFLKSYILEKRYLCGDKQEESDSDEDSEEEGYQMLSEEEEQENADKFELKYNFRFEEPDPDFIKSYPRTVSTTMRAEKNTRKEKRALVLVRKNQEKQKRREEINRLKNLKRKEIESRLKSIMEKSGSDRMPFTEEELDEDFNPEDHDRKMKEMFPDDEDNEDSLVKPTFEHDPEIDDNEDWDRYPVTSNTTDARQLSGNDEDILDPEDPNIVMDADYDPNAATLDERNFGLDGRSRRNKRKKHRLQKALNKKKPLFNPGSKTFDEYLDEYYGLECEDMIGDIKCRFPYREVPSNDFGLSVGEILAARDKELNSWSSLKKTVQYRSNEEEYKDVSKFRRKSHDIKKKQRLLPSLFKEEDDEQHPAQEEAPPVDSTISPSVSGLSPTVTGEEQTSDQADSAAAASNQITQTSHKGKRKAKWKGKQKQGVEPQYEQSSRGMSFKRMEAFGMHSEVKRVKKLRARDKRRI